MNADNAAGGPKQYASLRAALDEIAGKGAEVRRLDRVSGGDINEASVLTLSDGRKLFMKSNRRKDPSFFLAEAAGLSAIEQTKTLPSPAVLGVGTEEENGTGAFLLLAYVERSSPAGGAWGEFARGLARMHLAVTQAFVSVVKVGGAGDNYVCARVQKNTPKETWICFFRECRLEPQFRAAGEYFEPEDLRRIHRLLERLDGLLVEPGEPSLLHGDLWGGNVMPGGDGRLWLIDPAVYVGHREADLAMTELFGGFPGEFSRTYREVFPLQDGYEDRRDLYNLYQLLNHLNLFGGSYLSSVLRIVRSY